MTDQRADLRPVIESPRLRVARSAHSSRPWRIHEIAHDFRVLDVWALPTPGRKDDFPRLVRWMTTLDPTKISSTGVRTLFEIRRKLGELFDWDESRDGDAGAMPSLRDRVPESLREIPPEVEFDALPANSLYMTDDEFAAELINRTCHGVVHLSWVQDDSSGYRGQLAVLVKPNGIFGEAYLTAIAPFRHLFVYPTLIRELASSWRAEAAPPE